MYLRHFMENKKLKKKKKLINTGKKIKITCEIWKLKKKILSFDKYFYYNKIPRLLKTCLFLKKQKINKKNQQTSCLSAQNMLISLWGHLQQIRRK